MAALICTLVLFVALPTTVYAHEALPQTWTWNFWLYLAAAVSGSAYYIGQSRLARAHTGRSSSRRERFEQIAFLLAWLTLFTALLSPLDGLSDIFFSAHMLQHELLMLLAAPLFALSRPLHRYLWSLPVSLRHVVASGLRRPGSRAVVHLLAAPASALVLHAIVRWIWHVPFLFEAALDSEWVHGVQHATFFFSALLFYWVLLHGRYGRAGYGISALFVFATALHSGALGVLIGLARRPLYPRYAERAATYARDALADQQLAGLGMWIIAGLLFTLVSMALFTAWLGELERRARLAQ